MEEGSELVNRDKLLLKELSANSRSSLTHLAKVGGCSAMQAGRIVHKLITKLEIKFTLELDMDKLGLEEKHVLLVKFGKKPNEIFLNGFFKDDPYTHDVYLTRGDFDLFIFAAADTANNYVRWETELVSNLAEYLPELRPSSYMQANLGYMPLNSYFANFIKSDVKVDKKDKLILQLLNENSRASYREIGEKLGINEDTVRYRVFKLVRGGIILRFTIAAQNADGHLAAFFARYRFDRRTLTDVFPAMRRHEMSEMEELPAFNSTPMVVVLSGSYRFFTFTFGRTEEDALNFGIRWYSNMLKGNKPHIATATVLKAVKGLLPLRNLDVKLHYKYAWNTQWS
ncbi:MAG: Lrp/AsnC family transcriptional regulator [Candidatus Micrarchaeota archaeon]|nr:Lrp/AsnC family transcriptional regulator [Candidatus Micrarchaeota archaeon]